MSHSRVVYHWSRQLVGGLRRLTAAEVLVWSTWVGLLLLLGSLGSRINDEWFDLGAALSLLGWGTTTVVIHNARSLRLVSALARLLPGKSWWLQTLVVDWGVDLRRTPPIRRSAPRSWCNLAAGLAIGSLLILATVLWNPSGIRSWLVPRWYLAYLLPWTLLLASSLFVITVLLFLMWAVIHDREVTSFDGQGTRPVRREIVSMAGFTTFLLLASVLLPSWIPVAGMLLLLAVVSTALGLASSDLILVWRQEHRGRYGSFDGRLFVWFQAAAITLVLIDLVLLLGSGSELPGLGAWRIAPVISHGALLAPSRILARLFAWFSLGGALAIGFDAIQLAIQGIRFHPRRIARNEGQRLSAGSRFEERRPLEIRCRRKLMRGLERLFKRAARRKLPASSGLILGLQHWFVMGLRTDAPENYLEDRDATVFDGIIGRPFHRVFSQLTRFHYWQITTALELDLVYIEQNVSFRQFVRVMRQMFEIYDMHGGAVRAEDRHFQGLPGIKVMIHDVDAGTVQPRESSSAEQPFTEPEFRELDRARVLHVFKERQEHEVDVPTPGESNWAPDMSYLM